MTKITILVAVYNTEKYLRQCLDSLRSQTLKEFQVVCVDDASTDGSWKILQEYEAEDNRFEVIHLDENGGQAKARNIGLKRARGEYTCFLDSDDWLTWDALQKVVETFEKDEEIDCVLFKCSYVYPCNVDQYGKPCGMPAYLVESYPMAPFVYKSGKEAFVDSLTWKIHGIYAVKTSIHKRFPYDDSSHSFSDDNTTRLHYLNSRKVAMCEGEYNYRQHSTSVTHEVSVRRFDYLRANTRMRKYLDDTKVEDEYIDIYENHRWVNLVGMILFGMRYQKKFSETDWKSVKSLVRSTWLSIETHRLKANNHYKIGYLLFRNNFIPQSFGWKVFWMEEKFYFWIRKALKNLPE